MLCDWPAEVRKANHSKLCSGQGTERLESSLTELIALSPGQHYDNLQLQQNTTMAQPAKRRKYEACFKLKVVAFAKSHNNCAAAREFGVTKKMVRDWRLKEDLLHSVPRTKCVLRRGTAH